MVKYTIINANFKEWVNQLGQFNKELGTGTDSEELKLKVASLTSELDEMKRYKERDQLTGLYKYDEFINKLYKIMGNINEEENVVYIYADISNFKFFNESLGYEIGDKILKTFAELLINDKDALCYCRVHSDNFIIVLNYKKSIPEELILTDVIRKKQKATEIFREKCDINYLRLNLGVNVVDSKNCNIIFDIENANYARKLSKSMGVEVVLFKPEMYEKQNKNATMISEFEYALLNNEFEVYYQPKVDAVTHVIVGGEALIRWVKKEGLVIYPDDFIDLFEKNGYVVKLDYYVYDKVFSYIRQRLDEGKHIVPISMNLSRVHMNSDEIIYYIRSLLDKYNIDVKYIEFELTENIYISEMENTMFFIGELKKLGIKVSMDDFGSGYSSLNVLSKLAIDVVKIDKVFMKKGLLEENDKIIVECIVAMAKRLHMTVVCEGVETKEQSDYLANIGCEILQGYYFSRPIKEDSFSSYIDRNCRNKSEIIHFSFDGSLSDDTGKYIGNIVGSKVRFISGVLENRKVLYFPGGETNSEVIEMPQIPYFYRSFTIAFWMKSEKVNIWTSILYADFENVFFSMMPMGWNSKALFRMRDKEIVGLDAFVDVLSIEEIGKEWTHVSIVFNAENKLCVIYIDGKQGEKKHTSKTPLIMQKFILGGDIYQKSYVGYLGAFEVYNQALTIDDIENIYNMQKREYGTYTSEYEVQETMIIEDIIEQVKSMGQANPEYAKNLMKDNMKYVNKCKMPELKAEYYLVYAKLIIMFNELDDVVGILDKVVVWLGKDYQNENVRDGLLAETYNLYGVYYTYTNNYIKALDNYLVASKYAERLNDERKIASYRNNMGNLYSLVGDRKTAYEEYHAVVQIEERSNHEYVQGVELVNLAEMYITDGDYEEGKAYLAMAFKVLREKENYDDIASCYSVEALMYEKTGEIEKAYESYNKAYTMDEEYLSGADFEETRNRMLMFLIKNGYIDRAMELIEEVRSGKKIFVSLKKLVSMYDMAIDVAISRGEIELANVYLEMHYETMEKYWKEVNEENAQCIAQVLSVESLKKDNRELKMKSQNDTLTGLGNRYRLEDRGERIIREASSINKPICVMILDIDNFKIINDKQGHLFGDVCIKQVGDILQEIVGDSCVYRFGGDEFVVILDDVDEIQMIAVLKEIREQISSTGVFTVSIGSVLTIPNDSMGVYDYIRRADIELYKAKQKKNDYSFKVI